HAPHADSLDCKEKQGPDCADFFNFQPSAPGILRLSVRSAPREGSSEPPSPSAPFELSVIDPSGVVVGHAVAGAEPAVVLVNVREPSVFVASVTLPPGSGAQRYLLSFESQLRSAPVAQPQPGESPLPGLGSAKTRRWTVLEVEKKGGAAATSVLIDGGRRDALRTGLRGRLVDGQRTLGRVVVEEVFEEGSRARVEGPLLGDIT